ncbi:pentapeptide repeat-containing protein [Amycolatopsis sp. NPDC059027]|uniref:pentapeptide repeat-containing protein n=1 Tax=unclassified Amycolatopsis TaxID=2618356 RepID=UPI00367110EF
MTRKVLWGVVAGAVLFLGVVLVSLAWVPGLLFPPLSDADLGAVPAAETRIRLRQEQSQLQNGVRSTLLQLTAGLLVVAGAGATWRQVHVNREGQLTERFTRAVDQIGSDNQDVRIGGLYALERIARNSPADRDTIQFMLGAFVRNHSPWPAGSPDGPAHPTEEVDEQLPWMRVRAPDIQVAMGVLGRRPASWNQPVVFLSRVDLRSVALRDSRLGGAQLRYSNLARAVLAGIHLEHADLTAADLRRSYLERAHLVEANLGRAHLRGANLRHADLSGADLGAADLRGADLTDARLDRAVLAGARADASTVWPDGWDRERRQARGIVEDAG